MRIRPQATVCVISLCIFLLALTQNGYYLDHVPRDAWAPGWGEFAFGWLSLFSGTIAWLGNPLLIASWITLYRNRVKASAILALLALAVMLSFLLNKKIIFNEAGSESRISGYGLGYWLWVTSALVVVLGTCFIPKAPNKPDRSLDPTP
jgi:hypothetical protein